MNMLRMRLDLKKSREGWRMGEKSTSGYKSTREEAGNGRESYDWPGRKARWEGKRRSGREGGSERK